MMHDELKQIEFYITAALRGQQISDTSELHMAFEKFRKRQEQMKDRIEQLERNKSPHRSHY